MASSTDTRRITYNLPIKLIEAVNAAAKKRGVPKVQIIRECLTTGAALKVKLPKGTTPKSKKVTPAPRKAKTGKTTKTKRKRTKPTPPSKA